MATTSFDTELATRYGMNEAILLNHIQYWVRLNKYNKSEQHYIDGKYWTYNTHQAMLQIFPYWSINTIRRTLNSLVEQQLILTAQHHKMRHNRTTWYTLADEMWQFYDGVKLEPINAPKQDDRSTQNDTIDVPKMGNCQLPKMGTSYNNSHNQSLHTVNNNIPKSLTTDFDYSGFSPDEIEAIQDWLQYKAETKQKYKPTGLKSLRKLCVRLASHNLLVKQIEQAIAAGYKGIVEPKDLPSVPDDAPPPIHMFAGHEAYLAAKKGAE